MEKFVYTTRPLWGCSGNLIAAHTKVTQKEMSASLQELAKIGIDEVARQEQEFINAGSLQANQPKGK